MSTSISVRIINAEGMPATGDNFHRGEGKQNKKKIKKKTAQLLMRMGSLEHW